MNTARHQPGYGMGSAEIHDPLEQHISRVRGVLTQPGFEPPTLPKAAMEILRLSQCANTSVAEITRVLESDATLAARLLQRARSPQFGTRPVQDIRQAAARMGVNGLRDLVLQISMRMKVFKAPGYEPLVKEVMRYSQVRAALCPVVSRFSNTQEPSAPLCALLSDLGLATALMVLAQVPRGAQQPSLGLAWAASTEVHEQAGSVLARSWGLPGEVVAVIGHHHQVEVARIPNPLIATLMVAAVVAEHLEIGLHTPDGQQQREDRAQVNSARKLLGLNTEKMKRIVAQARSMDLNSII